MVSSVPGPLVERRPERRVVAPARRLVGVVEVPGDKSISHRALLCNAVARGVARVRNLGPGGDCQTTLRCVRALGVRVDQETDGSLVVHGVGLGGLREPEDVLDAENSGTTARLLAGLLAAHSFLSVLTGDASLRRRPMGRVATPLQRMGATVLGRAGGQLLPLAIRGGALRGIRYETPVASAQVKSALLLAGLHASGPTELREPAPSRDHTERLLRAQGAALDVAEGRVVVEGGHQLRAVDVDVPGDFSSAAFWLVAACLHPQARITVRGVGVNPGRTGLLEALEAMGGRVTVSNERVVGGEPVADVTAESSQLRGIEVGGALIPRLIDEVPILAVAAAVAAGPTLIRDAAELRAKESDRLHTVAAALRLLGAEVEELPDGLAIAGGARLRGATCHSAGDHRVAMAVAVAGLVADGPVTVEGAEAADVSYPSFWNDLDRLAER